MNPASNELRKLEMLAGGKDKFNAVGIHPAWREFILYCRELRFGEIERLSIQDGLPVLAEVTLSQREFV